MGDLCLHEKEARGSSNLLRGTSGGDDSAWGASCSTRGVSLRNVLESGADPKAGCSSAEDVQVSRARFRGVVG